MVHGHMDYGTNGGIFDLVSPFNRDIGSRAVSLGGYRGGGAVQCRHSCSAGVHKHYTY